MRSCRSTSPAKKASVRFDTDEYIRHGATAEALGELKPAFSKDGTVTAGNASGINDGAAAVVMMSAARARELDLAPMACDPAYSSAGRRSEGHGHGTGARQ